MFNCFCVVHLVRDICRLASVLTWCALITVTSHGLHGASNHWQLHSLFNRLFSCILKNTSNLAFMSLVEGNPSATGGFLSQRAIKADIYNGMTSLWKRKGRHVDNIKLFSLPKSMWNEFIRWYFRDLYEIYLWTMLHNIIALYLKILRPKQDGRYFADIFKCIVQMKIVFWISVNNCQ